MSRERGYTMIEILVALAIIATAVAAIVAGVSGYVSNAAYLRDRTLAQWVVMNKVAELQLGNAWPTPGAQHGASLMADHEWSWEVNNSATDDPDVVRLDVSAYADTRRAASLADAVANLGGLHPARTAGGARHLRGARGHRLQRAQPSIGDAPLHGGQGGAPHRAADDLRRARTRHRAGRGTRRARRIRRRRARHERRRHRHRIAQSHPQRLAQSARSAAQPPAARRLPRRSKTAAAAELDRARPRPQ